MKIKIVSGILTLTETISRSVVTIGNFDGIHLGHRQLISRIVEEAARLKSEAIVMTFDPHPVKVLFPQRKLSSLFPREDQHGELEKMGVDRLIIEPFSRELSQTSATQFLQDWIIKPLSPQKLVVGHDFSFGANRSGGTRILEELCNNWKIALEIIAPVKVEGQIVSSSRIRKSIAEGRVDLAHQLLGRAFHVRGTVERGDGRGGQIGFPTANLVTQSETLPKAGVYVSQVRIREKSFNAVTNVGRNPTFSLTQPVHVEAHLLDFNQNLYGEKITVEFLHYLRAEKKFESPEALIAQIHKDIRGAKKYF